MIDCWLGRLQTYSRLWIGFSGGVDSAVLLHCLATYKRLLPPLKAIHINHGLSPKAMDWQTHCERFCEALEIPLLTQQVEFNRVSNIEAEARKGRYTAFSAQLLPGEALLLAHHADDQAETVLLQLFRGAGITGLAAMPEIAPLAAGMLIRPLLQHSRQCIEDYAALHGLHWIEDESNSDEKYSRNFLRHAIFPLLQQKWPSVVGNINRTAKHCQEAIVNLEALAELDFGDINPSSATLPISILASLSKERVINCLRFWVKKNKVSLPSSAIMERIYSEVIAAKPDANPEVSWGETAIRRYQQALYLTPIRDPVLPTTIPWPTFPEPLKLGASVINPIDLGLNIPKDCAVEIRFRQGGELFLFHGHQKALKKLLQQWKVPPWMRDRIPLVFVDNQLAAVVGFGVSDLFSSQRV